MIEKHERKHKQQRSLDGRERGGGAAGLDAAGAGWSSFAMAAFATPVWLSASRGALISRLFALVVSPGSARRLGSVVFDADAMSATRMPKATI